MTLRTAIVGCGAVSQRLYRKPLQQLRKQGLLEVVALVDPAASHSAAMQPFFKSAKTFTGLQQALDATRPELTLVLTPAHLHAAQTVLALERGSHVLCEKPMASTSAECRRMNAVAKSTGCVLAVGMIRRFFPAFAQLRELVRVGELGAVLSFEYREGHKFEWAVTTPAAFSSRKEGGAGVLFDIGTHALDFVESIFGQLTVVGYSDDALGGIDSSVSMQLDASGVAGTVDLTWDVPQTNQLRVRGEKGEAVLRLDRFDQIAVDFGAGFVPRPVTISFPADLEPSTDARMTPLSYPDAIYCQLIQVLRAVRRGEQAAVSGESGERCIKVLEDALSIAKPIEEPWLDPAVQAIHRKQHWKSRVCL